MPVGKYAMKRYVKPKKIIQSQITGQRGVNFVEQVVLEMHFTWHPTNAGLEAGIDGIIEICDPETGEATNNIIQVQVKGTTSDWISDTPTTFTYYCNRKDIDYWMQGNTPIILIAVRPDRKEAYWVNIKEFFADPKKRNQTKIVFDKATQKFNTSVALDLIKLAVPKDIGPYLPATEHEETLYSNLLEIKNFPSSIYSASTDYRNPDEIFDWEKEHKTNLPSGWILTDKMLRSVHDIREEPWPQLCDRGSVEQFDICEWSDSDDPDVQREFVRLMNQVLRHDMRIKGLWFSKDEQCFFFPAKRSIDGKPQARSYHYRSLEKYTPREVVSSYQDPDTGEIINFRHCAMKHSFVRIDGRWYLAIVPHYIYTTDGKTPYLYAENLLSGIKRLEHQSAVLGQTTMWKYKLTYIPNKTFFDSGSSDKPMIVFGNFLGFKCERGLDDKSWRKSDILLEEDSDNWGLF